MDLKDKKCRCGAPAARTICSQTGLGLEFTPICQPCHTKCVDLLKQVREMTGMTWYNFPPTLRPPNAFDEEDKHAAR